MIKVSYLVSTYDSGSYLDRHLEDLITRQTDPNFEIVIVNPNSPGTDDIIARKWESIDERVRYIYHPEREWYGESWLRAWEVARGRYVMNSNTDDLHEPRTTELVYKHMTSLGFRSDKKHAFAYGGMTVIDAMGNIKGRGLKPSFDFETMTRECWAGPQVAWCNDKEFRAELDWDFMRLRASQYRSAFDFFLWLYFMSLGYHGYCIPEFLTIYTQREDSIENSNKWANNYETYSAISEFFPYNLVGALKHAKEFADFSNLPPREEWIATMQAGKKWKR